MVGLPYPNLKSPELKEKMDYLNANMVSAACTSVTIFLHSTTPLGGLGWWLQYIIIVV